VVVLGEPLPFFFLRAMFHSLRRKETLVFFRPVLVPPFLTFTAGLNLGTRGSPHLFFLRKTLRIIFFSYNQRDVFGLLWGFSPSSSFLVGHPFQIL